MKFLIHQGHSWYNLVGSEKFPNSWVAPAASPNRFRNNSRFGSHRGHLASESYTFLKTNVMRLYVLLWHSSFYGLSWHRNTCCLAWPKYRSRCVSSLKCNSLDLHQPVSLPICALAASSLQCSLYVSPLYQVYLLCLLPRVHHLSLLHCEPWFCHLYYSAFSLYSPCALDVSPPPCALAVSPLTFVLDGSSPP